MGKLNYITANKQRTILVHEMFTYVNTTHRNAIIKQNSR